MKLQMVSLDHTRATRGAQTAYIVMLVFNYYYRKYVRTPQMLELEFL